MKRLLVGFTLLGVLFVPRESAAAEQDTPPTAGAGGSIAFNPSAGLVMPLSGSSAIDEQLGVGGQIGASLGWLFRPVGLVLAGRLDYARHAPNDLSSYFPATDREHKRGSGTGIFDATVEGRYWVTSWFYADAVLGWTVTSLVRVRDIGTGSHAINADPSTFRRDIAPDSGPMTGTGIGFAVVRLTDGHREPNAAMVNIGVGWRLRVLASGSLMTLPLTISLNL